MHLIHHVVRGEGQPPLVFVHGFACAHADWDTQVAYFSPRHRTVTVDLRGHGQSLGEAAECSIERYGADVAEVMRALSLPPAVLIGHSMGCRVVLEAALQAPERVAGIVFVDGSQFSPVMESILRVGFAAPDGYVKVARSLFTDMFTAKTDLGVRDAVIARAEALPRPIGEKMLLDLLRYDVGRLEASLDCVNIPVMALQTTYSNEKRERRPLQPEQTTPYLEMVKAHVPSARIAIIPETGHFPQLDESERTNSLIEDFVTSLRHA